MHCYVIGIVSSAVNTIITNEITIEIV